MNHPKRKLIPDEQTIVVLDTSPVRNIAYADATPAWVATFVEMADDGYAFSLADGALAELLAQYNRGSLTDGDLTKILAAISQFLNPDLPILPGKRDIMAMIGESTDGDWCEDDVREFALRGWAVLNDPSLLDEERREELTQALQYDRDEWIGWFAKFDSRYARWTAEQPGREKQELNQYKHDLLDEELADLAAHGRNPQPTMAMRLDLQMRYIWRQWVRTRQKRDGYDPTSEKKVNDGIDLDLYRYLILPALVVTDDRGFHERLADIKSDQRHWFWRPQALADAWVRGERPRPVWPAPVIAPLETQSAG
ncbi:hypothetical protein G2912_14625 [Paraburkholderia aspalathi]|uniref:DUF4935 domain-containing protein n=1 Tax=Paraburkholderia nemoris TaxID=2793076 RepID=A0ABM8RP23_9BURK|nr:MULTISPECIES: hypothetical protein [Paraburkholderia]MBK3811590.1 hypothetical protein [Paraburkholderia aspalathi]CAE6763873.1 hypothetical protein R69776_03496 [Paraburkholderia nemoris]